LYIYYRNRAYLNISTTEYSNPVLSVSLIPAVTEAAEEHVTILAGTNKLLDVLKSSPLLTSHRVHIYFHLPQACQSPNSQRIEVPDHERRKYSHSSGDRQLVVNC